MDPKGRALERELLLFRKTVIPLMRVMFHQFRASPSLRLRGPWPEDVHQTRSQRNRRRPVMRENLAATFSPRDWEEEDTPYEGPEREEELVRGLRDMKQIPPPGPFSREDLMWLPIRTQGGGCDYIHDVAVIPWRRFQDFREGEGQDKSYPCRFNKETVKNNKPGSLVFSRANSAAKVIK